jgi:glycosyltransferase involved in cell wall biosynthesis
MPNRTIHFGPEVFTRQRVGGISRYFCELFIALAERDACFAVHANPEENLMLRAAAATLGDRLRSFRGRRAMRLIRALRLDVSFAQRMSRESPSSVVVHHTYYPVVPIETRRPVVTTIHDLCDERLGRGLAAKRRSMIKRRAAERADLIIAVSQATKRDIVDYWDIPEQRIVVAHHGVRQFQGPFARSFINGPFLLYMGRRNGYKNFGNAVKAYLRAGLHKEMALLCFGGDPFSAMETALLKQLGLAGRVIYSSGGDAELHRAYSDAVALVYPSLFEGFGLPLLEAMICGCPVVCGNHTSLPEVGGDAVLYTDTGDIEALASALKRVAFDNALRSELAARGRCRAATFTWAASADAHLQAYGRL